MWILGLKGLVRIDKKNKQKKNKHSCGETNNYHWSLHKNVYSCNQKAVGFP